MSDTKTQQIWLMRGISDKQSLMFSVAVSVEQENDFFAAAVVTMQDQMAATGRDPEEAINHARTLFMATVDDALEKGRSIQYATGQTPITLDLPVWMAPKFFHLLETKIWQSQDDEPQWLSIPSDEVGTMHHVE